MRRVAALILLAAVLGACAGGGATSTGPDRCSPDRILRVGDALPECTFERLEGGTLRLGELEGKPAVLNFWASWCASCLKEMPAFQQIHESLGTRVTILGVNELNVLGESRRDAERFAEARGVRYPNVYDPDGLLYSHFFGSTARPVLPLTVFADARGRVAKVNVGELTERDLRDTLRSLFAVG